MLSLWGTQETLSRALGHFQHGDNQTTNQPTKQRGDPSACLLLMSEKAVLCNILLSFLHRKTCAKDGDNDDHVHGTGGGGNDEKQ